MKSIDVTGDEYIGFLKKAKLMLKDHVKISSNEPKNILKVYKQN